MKMTIKRLQSIVDDWKCLYQRYDKQMEIYNSTPKFIRWLKGLREPNAPGFHSATVVCNSIIPVIVELRCHDRTLFAAVRVDDKGYLQNLRTDERTPLLGSRGMEIDHGYVDYIDKILKDLKTLSL